MPELAEPTPDFGRYKLIRRVSLGGSAEIYKAKAFGERGFEKVVALKRILPHAEENPEFVRMFVDEAQLVAQLDHPHVARVHERGQEHGHAYLVLDLLPGGDLEERLRKGPLPVGEVVSLTAQLAAGLAHIHAHSLLHRDIKPANVLFDEHGQPRWVDFGLVRAAGSSSLTETGAVLGTPAYMAPEQALGLGQELDPRADVYGLGALLYHCLTGAPPFGGGSLIATLQQVVEEAPRAPSQLRPELSPAIDAVCLRALAKERDDAPVRIRMADRKGEILDQRALRVQLGADAGAAERGR